MRLLRCATVPWLHGLLCAGLFAALLGCSAADDSNRSGSSGGEGGAGGSASSGNPSGTGGSGGLSLGVGGGGTGGGPPQVAEVYSHSSGVLYKLDPITKEVTTIGPFNGCGSQVIDIAIDEKGEMFGTTFAGLNRIDKATANCTPVSSGSYPNSLSFVPKGTVDPNVEALVGYNGGTYVRIDTTTGSVSTIGSLGGGYVSSGDIVSVIGGGTYLTVKGPNCNDCIVQVDPTTGALQGVIGPLGRSDVFGLAFWAGSAYGFNDDGQLFEIDLMTAAVTDIPMPNPPPGLSFWGAGSTTAAPLTPPE